MMQQLEAFHPTSLRTYDIRGIVGLTLTDGMAYTLGRVFGSRVKSVAVGYDGRTTSEGLAGALARGLVDAGCDVMLVGQGPTPMAYFAERHLGTDACIMVTGSHNPPEYNGFKISLHKKPFWGPSIKSINEDRLTLPPVGAKGTLTSLDIRDAYVDRMVADFNVGRPLRVVWDCGNGAAACVIDKLIAKIPGTHRVLFGDVDGTFPNHHPDPTVDENLHDLQKAVREGEFDLGIAFDGDGDRIGAVDAHGNIIRGDILMTIFARDVLATHPGAPIIADVKCSSTLFGEIARLGGKPVMEKTGHSSIKSKMAELQSPLAGELSGHVFFADTYYGYDDALYAAVRLLNAVGHADFKSLLGHLPTTYSTPELRIDVEEDDKADLMKHLIDGLSSYAKTRPDMTVSTIDGVRCDTAQGWCLVRASNTTPCLIARAEATTQAGLSQMCDLLQTYLTTHGLRLAA